MSAVAIDAEVVQVEGEPVRCWSCGKTAQVVTLDKEPYELPKNWREVGFGSVSTCGLESKSDNLALDRYAENSEKGPRAWRFACARCAPESNDTCYQIPLDRINTFPKAVWWLIHTSHKRWYTAASWSFGHCLYVLFGNEMFHGIAGHAPNHVALVQHA